MFGRPHRSAVQIFQSWKHRFVFGSTSAIITIMGLIVGLNSSVNAKMNIIISILLVAIADNISDSLGIHIYQEAEGFSIKEVYLSSVANFTARFLVSMLFVLLVALLPLRIAVACCLILGLFLLSFVSYLIAVNRKTNPVETMTTHLLIALSVILASTFLGRWLLRFHG